MIDPRDTPEPYPNPKVEEGKTVLVEEISKDRMRSIRIGEVEISGRGTGRPPTTWPYTL